MSNKSVYIAYTGGTIGMKQSDDGWKPEKDYLEDQIKDLSIFYEDNIPNFTIKEFEPLLDSSNMTPNDWMKIAKDIESVYDEFDGFVVLHGTDTMAYSASALAFMFKEIQKPVIVTGSQIPMIESRTDARQNLLTSILIAGNSIESTEQKIPEVCLYFDNELYRGCRSVKINCDGFHAFDSPNFLPLAKAGITLDVNEHLIRSPIGDNLKIQTQMDPNIGVLWLFPGIQNEVIQNFLKSPLKGVVLLAYGVGNGPEDDQFLDVIKKATDNGIVIVDCTQCMQGTVNLSDYATGSALSKAGVISGFDMTAEAALTKLSYLFGGSHEKSEIENLIQTDLRGELTKPKPVQPPPPWLFYSYIK